MSAEMSITVGSRVPRDRSPENDAWETSGFGMIHASLKELRNNTMAN